MSQPDHSVVHEYEYLTVIWRPREQSLIIAVAGEIDMDNADQLERELNNAGQATSQPLIIDMAAVSFLGSAGVHALVRHRQAAGRPIGLRNLRPDVRRVLDISGILPLFDIFTSSSTT